jgi:hypothetical protein
MKELLRYIARSGEIAAMLELPEGATASPAAREKIASQFAAAAGISPEGVRLLRVWPHQERHGAFWEESMMSPTAGASHFDVYPLPGADGDAAAKRCAAWLRGAHRGDTAVTHKVSRWVDMGMSRREAASK